MEQMKLWDTNLTINKLQERIQELLEQGLTIDEAVKQAYEENPVMEVMRAEVDSQILAQAEKGFGRPIPPEQETKLQEPWAGDGLNLSQRTIKGNAAIVTAVKEALTQAVKKNTTYKETAMKLFDGYKKGGIIPEQDIPHFMEKLINFTRKTEGWGEKERRYIKDIEKHLRKMHTKGLQSAYNMVLQAVQRGNTLKLNKAIYTATQERTRYFAERIARTELARAYHDGFIARWDDDPDCIGYKWMLSSRHPVFDICDLYAKADLYGMGKGVFPKGKVPMLPTHPHCMCHLKPIIKGSIKNEEPREQIEKGGLEYINGLSKYHQEKLLGVYGRLSVLDGARPWTSKVRNYTAEKIKTRLDKIQLMEKNLIPPTDEFIKSLADKYGKPYTIGKDSIERFYDDNGDPIYPPNDGALGSIERKTLKAGITIVDRYGGDGGQYVSPEGTKKHKRALPRNTPDDSLKVYKIIKDIEVDSAVIAPWFGEEGKGIQYKFDKPIGKLLNVYLKEVKP